MYLINQIRSLHSLSKRIVVLRLFYCAHRNIVYIAPALT